jgi:hypothetical protein
VFVDWVAGRGRSPSQLGSRRDFATLIVNLASIGACELGDLLLELVHGGCANCKSALIESLDSH